MDYLKEIILFKWRKARKKNDYDDNNNNNNDKLKSEGEYLNRKNRNKKINIFK